MKSEENTAGRAWGIGVVGGFASPPNIATVVQSKPLPLSPIRLPFILFSILSFTIL